MHGKDAEVEHDGRTIFEGLPSPLVAGRYHSLVADPDSIPDELEVSARLGDVIMGARHRELPAEGVQFHPESVLTPQGKELLKNFLAGERSCPATGETMNGRCPTTSSPARSTPSARGTT